MRFTPDRREHIAIALASDDKLDELPIVSTNSQRKSHRVRSRVDAGRFSGLPVFYFHDSSSAMAAPRCSDGECPNAEAIPVF